jgi:pyruvate/2-oxoglutarate dehydrogenase complex dihydrolipoamide acyltransferase (E2) component
VSRLVESYARRAAEAAATMPRFSVSVDAGWRDEGDVLRAVRKALEEGEGLNAAWRDGAVVDYDSVGIAVLLPGPVSPVVSDFSELEALRARDPESFTAAELAGATFTVVFAPDVDSIEPPLVSRQAGVLGVGRSRLTLACDARAVAIEAASAFLQHVRVAYPST